MVTVFTLVICLVVVALSGAAVLHITLVDPTKRATPKYHRPRDPRIPTPPRPLPTVAPEVRPGSESSADVRPEPEVHPEPDVRPETEVHPEPDVRPEPDLSPTPEVRRDPEVRRPPEVIDPAGPEGGAVVHGAVDVNRARSAGLLVLLLTSIGGVLAVAVAVGAVAAAVALRAALMG